MERRADKTVALLQEGRANYSIIVLKEGKMFSCWCRTQDDAMALVMAAILLRTGRQDVVDAAREIDIDEIVEKNLDEDEGSGWR